MLWLCIQLPTLPLEARNPIPTKGEQSGALAVGEQQRIVARIHPAAEGVVAVGLSSATICARTSSLPLLQRDRAQEQQQLAQLAQWGCRPACLLLDLSGCLKTCGGLRVLLDQVQQALEQMNLNGLMGLGHNPSAARLLSQLPSHRRWLTHTHSAPSPQQRQQWIDSAPSKLLDCDHRTITQLHACGIRRVHQLRTMPLSELNSRFGRSFVEYLTRLNGSRHYSAYGDHPSARCHSVLGLRTPLENREQLPFPASRLLRAVCESLQRHPCFPRAPLAPQRLLTLTRLQLTKAAPAHPVRTLRLVCSQPEPLARETEALLDKGGQALLDKLKARLGHQALSTIALKDGDLPERAWQRAGIPPLPGSCAQKRPPPPPCHPPAPTGCCPVPAH
ncbi:DNA polymerase Y family protein [Microbulbifer spongiae]|uniref:DNA polymerase Y family protein n=1 Tax=Microbulbifer spongiae TaxID=2944933 RepID=A0ABY9E6G7_9GAMM|nr:DNA polymerase Y family protein [Microbulbifer sp. MI-G]WKD48613.1 DNA polymerase Y family protein [Microbulbifer sp. MI-G]